MVPPACRILIAVLGTCTLVGCNRGNTSSNDLASRGVAVIDLDRVAQQLGSDKQIAQSLSERQQSLNEQLGQLARAYQQQLHERQQSDEPPQPANQGVQLASWQAQANQQIARAKTDAANQLAQHRLQLVGQFRAAIKPAVRAVASQRGLTLVVTKNDSVIFDYAEQIDITDAVVAQLKAGPRK